MFQLPHLSQAVASRPRPMTAVTRMMRFIQEPPYGRAPYSIFHAAARRRFQETNLCTRFFPAGVLYPCLDQERDKVCPENGPRRTNDDDRAHGQGRSAAQTCGIGTREPRAASTAP